MLLFAQYSATTHSLVGQYWSQLSDLGNATLFSRLKCTAFEASQALRGRTQELGFYSSLVSVLVSAHGRFEDGETSPFVEKPNRLFACVKALYD